MKGHRRSQIKKILPKDASRGQNHPPGRDLPAEALQKESPEASRMAPEASRIAPEGSQIHS